MSIAYGKKYQRDLSEKQIAKLVRQEIEADRRRGHLPAGKYSVRIGGSNTHSTIDVRISELACDVFDRDFLLRGAERHYDQQRKAGIPLFRYSAPVRAAVARVEAMLEAYNFSDTGSLSNVNYYASVDVLADERAARAAALEAQDYAGEAAMVRDEIANVLPFVAPVRPSEEPEQVRFMREAGLV